MTIRAIISAKDFLFMSRFAAVNDGRYYLEGVSVEPQADATILVATDGHAMGILRLPHQEGEAYSIGEKFLLAVDKALVRACRVKKKEIATIVCHDDRVDVYVTQHALEIADLRAGNCPVVPAQTFPAQNMYITGSFPAWQNVVPGERDVLPREGRYATDVAYCSGIDPELLMRCRYSDEKPEISFDFDEGDPVLVTNADPRFLGVVMPFRAGMTRQEILQRRRDVLGALAK